MTLGNFSQPWIQEAAGRSDSCLACLLQRVESNMTGMAGHASSASLAAVGVGGQELPSFTCLWTDCLLLALFSPSS